MTFALWGRRFRINPNWKITLFYLLLMPLLLSLGYWQLHRAEEKASLEQRYQQRSEAEPLAPEQLDSLDAGALDYRRVELFGRYDNARSFLLDNRLYQGRPGYAVITPFVLARPVPFAVEGERRELEYLWIDRGWIAMGRDRSDLPRIPDVWGDQSVVAQITSQAEAGLVLKDVPLSGAFPVVIQRVDLEAMADYIGGDYGKRSFPYLVRLVSEQPGVLQLIWAPINMTPEKHLGYALQWFSMAGALTILYLLVTLSRVKD